MQGTQQDPAAHKRAARGEDVVGLVLRSIALAALALAVGIAASLLVDARQVGLGAERPPGLERR